jgi:hypothetical protein
MTPESSLRFPGTPGSPVVLIVPPLFDEANRMRRTLALMMRALSALGTQSLLPDLPGQNDSLIATEAVALSDWRTALAAVAAREAAPVLVASWRGGALIDEAVADAIGWWRMAPVAGAGIVKAMIRTRIAGDKESGRQSGAEVIRASAAQGPVELAGNFLSAAMLDALDAAVPAPVEPLRLVAPADFGGSALWLRAEPGEDAAMAQAMAADIHAWAVTCAAR